MNSLTLLPILRMRAASNRHSQAAAEPGPTPLARRELLTIPAPRGRLVRCLSGSLWLTFEGCRTDIVLGPGDSHRCSERGPMIVQALRDAVVQVR